MQPLSLIFVTLMLSVARPAVAAGEIHVPGDFPDPQSAINAALPGDLIVVHGGTWGSIVIDKPLHLLGDPTPLFEGELFFGYWRAPIGLAGPGSGVVTLSNIATGGSVPSSAAFSSAGVQGGLFAELHVFDSTLRGPAWGTASSPEMGAEGISVYSVPFLLIERSTVEASPAFSSGTPGGEFSMPAINALSSTVVVLDSTVQGGTGGPYYLWWAPCGSGGSCPGCDLGVGGTGIVCDTLHHAGSVILGGKGADWFDALGTYCTTLPDGPPFIAATEVPLSNNLLGTGQMKLGSTYGLLWTTPGPSAWLFFSPGSGPPMEIPGIGFAYLDFGSVVSLGVFSAPGAITFAIPALPSLLGQEVALQAFDPAVGVTRPIVGTLQP